MAGNKSKETDQRVPGGDDGGLSRRGFLKLLCGVGIPVSVDVFILGGCASQISEQNQPPNSESSPTGLPTTNNEPSPTGPANIVNESTPTPFIEPTPIPPLAADILPISPPEFLKVETEAESQFDLNDAHAVYAYSRTLTSDDETGYGPRYFDPNNFEPEFVQAMEVVLNNLQSDPQHRVELKQVSAPGIKYSMLTRGSQFFAYFTPEGVLADYVPGHWSKTGIGQWVEAGGTNGPLELFIGEDGLAYIAQLGLNDDVVYRFFSPIGATLDNLDEQWIPVRDGKSTLSWDEEQGQWVKVEEKLDPIETEFEGVFSEKYYPDQFTDSFTVVDKESGIEIPIHVGLASGLPVKAVHLTELGREYLGDVMLFSSYYRYTETMGNQATYEEYIELVKQGKGQVQIDYFDELTNEHKQAWYDPRNGVSITQTYDNEEMPLNSVPIQNSWDELFYFSANKSGQLILVIDRDKRLLDIIAERGRNQGYNMKQSYSKYFYTGFIAAMKYWAMLTPEHFASGGLESLVGDRAALFVAYEKDTYTERIKSINPRVDDRIPHMSVELSNR